LWALYLPLLIPALVALGARPLAAVLDPRQATWLLTTSAVALAACSFVALALLTAYAAARMPVLATLGDYSQRIVRRADPIPLRAGALAGIALVAGAVAVAVLFRSRARALADAYRRAALLHVDNGVVVVPGTGIEAYALPGRPGRIVVSGELLDRLNADGRAALLAHERAHLAGRHHIFVAAAWLAAAANPMLIPVARAVGFTVERWADEQAAVVTGDRGLVAATIGRVALLASARPTRLPSMSLGVVAASAARRMSLALAGPVPRRVAALLTAPPRRRIAVFAACLAVVAVAGVAALDTAGDLHALLELARAHQ
jgi:Zn-dependent protease with chaperone function